MTLPRKGVLAASIVLINEAQAWPDLKCESSEILNREGAFSGVNFLTGIFPLTKLMVKELSHVSGGAPQRTEGRRIFQASAFSLQCPNCHVTSRTVELNQLPTAPLRCGVVGPAPLPGSGQDHGISVNVGSLGK